MQQKINFKPKLNIISRMPILGYFCLECYLKKVDYMNNCFDNSLVFLIYYNKLEIK